MRFSVVVAVLLLFSFMAELHAQGAGFFSSTTGRNRLVGSKQGIQLDNIEAGVTALQADLDQADIDINDPNALQDDVDLIKSQAKTAIGTICANDQKVNWSGGAWTCDNEVDPTAKSFAKSSLPNCIGTNQVLDDLLGCVVDNTYDTETDPLTKAHAKVAMPQCATTEKLRWTGVVWECITDQISTGGETDPNVLAHGKNAAIVCDAASAKLHWDNGTTNWSCATDAGSAADFAPIIACGDAGSVYAPNRPDADGSGCVEVAGSGEADITFARAVGGISDEQFNSIQQTTDGGYIAAGYTSSYGAGGTDGLIVKFNAGGVEQWSTTVGGVSTDNFDSIQQAADGGYIAAGRTYSYGAGSYDGFIVKFDASGIEQWSKTVGGLGWDEFSSVQQTADGGYIVAGKSSSYGAGNNDGFIVKFDASGVEQWSKTLGWTNNEIFKSIQQTTDGGYIVAGSISSYGAGSYDGFIVKFNASGVEQWSKTVGGNLRDRFDIIQQTADGGYIVAGSTESYGAGNDDGFIVKFNSTGVEQWSKTVGGGGYDYFYDVQQTPDGGYIAIGRTGSYGAGSTDGLIVKFDASGIEQWSKTIGGSSWDIFNSIQQTSDGGYIVAGYTDSYGTGSYDAIIVKLDANGNIAGTCTPLATQTITEADQTITEADQTITEADQTIAEVDQTSATADTSQTGNLTQTTICAGS